MRGVENRSPAEELPALYRAVLDGVAELERLGDRGQAARTRTEAVRAYSRSWDATGRRRLETILRRTERSIAETHRTGVVSAPRRVTSTL
jgi:hypothetical protein